MAERQRQPRVIPGFGLSLGYTMLYLSLVILIPLGAIFVKSAGLSWHEFVTTVTRPAVMSSYLLSFSTAFVAALVNLFIGLIVAWVLTRYRFFGRRILDAIIDLPFALPTAVAGIALVTVYDKDVGWIGKPLAATGFRFPWVSWVGFENGHWPFGVEWYEGIARTPLGITMALVFIGLPFVVRTIQPVLQDMGREIEEAAESLGASRWQTFYRVLLPELAPALLTGFALAFARGLGEYGSIVFMSTNKIGMEIVPHRILYALEGNQYSEATAIAMVMLIASFLVLLTLNLVHRWLARRGMIA
jgi:sulfate transport system permease protein